MTNAPALARFQRSMVTKHAGKCTFCAAPTTPGIDFAALDNGKWIAVCALHAASTVEQAKALLLLIDSEAATANLTDADKLAIQGLIPADLGNVLTGSADESTTVAVVTALGNVRQAVAAFRPAPVRSNSYAGTCQTCKGEVAVGAGRIDKSTGKWLTFHLDGQCSTTPVATVERVAEGRYALDVDGVVKFYRVEHGRAGSKWDGCTFLSAQASDELHPIRNRQHREAILALIAADETEALARYGREVGKCGRCGRTLTSEWRQRGIGPVCAAKAW